MTKIAVIGSRNPSLESVKAVYSWLDEYRENNDSDITIVTGGAFGMDTEAMNYAVENHLKLQVFAPNKFHNSELCSELKGRAGCEIIDTNLGYLDRNTLIIDNADFVVCSDYGNGTIDGIEKAVSSGKKVYVLGKYVSSSRVKKNLPESELVLIHNV